MDGSNGIDGIDGSDGIEEIVGLGRKKIFLNLGKELVED